MPQIHVADWHKRTNDIYPVIFLGFSLVTFIVLVVLPINNWNLRLVIWAASLLPVFSLGTLFYYAYTDQIQKVYFVDRRDTVTIVTRVLDDKQLPYKKSWNGDGYNFHLEDAYGLTVQIKSYNPGGKNYLSETVSSMSIVKLQPITATTQPLSDSLRRKLDEAFAPAGLSETNLIK